jgi:proteasome accessory factor A
MPVPRLFGVETEYAISHLTAHGECMPRHELVVRLMETAVRRLPHLCSVDGRGLFLANGGRLYIDITDHPEFATPECTHPLELAAKIRESDAILASLASELECRYGGQVLVTKTNVDYASGTAWGCHESFMIKRGVEVNKHLIPFLCSRQVFTGAGGWNNLSKETRFVLSPRVPHLEHVVSRESTHSRGIIHQPEVRNRDVDLQNEFSRIHLIVGESLFSETSIVLKAGATSLVVGLIEAGLKPGKGVSLVNPLQAMRDFSTDPACKATAELENGRRLTAIDIQRHYLRLATQHSDKLPVWSEGICRLWEEVLNGLEAGTEQKRLRLDWVIRHHLFRQLLEYSKRTELEARMELFELDTKFGQVGERGVFHRLDSKGCLNHGIQAGLLAEEGAKSRAAARGQAILHCYLNGDRSRVLAEWSYLYNYEQNQHLNLRDPFSTGANWEASQTPLGGRRARGLLQLFSD